MITPPGGWLDPPSSEGADRHAVLSRPRGLTCKVCEFGILVRRKVFRLSGPAVVIGYILLIPSVCGVIFSSLLLLGWLTTPLPAARPIPVFQSTFDAGFRRSCAASARQNYYYRSGLQAPQTVVESYCECALAAYRVTASQQAAAQECLQRAQDGTLDQVGPEVDALYSDTPHENVAANESPIVTAVLMVFRFIGSAGAVAMGIGFFVSGLLGWLLVMKKQVLKCEYCGAVVNAS